MDKLLKAEQERRALIQMYQAGFIDGSKRKWNNTTKKACINAFNKRFAIKLQKEIPNARKRKKRNQRKAKGSNKTKKPKANSRRSS